jgi:hypothetical protein
MKSILSVSILPGLIIGFSVLIGQVQTVGTRNYPVTYTSNLSDDLISFGIPFIGGFSLAAGLYSGFILKNSSWSEND